MKKISLAILAALAFGWQMSLAQQAASAASATTSSSAISQSGKEVAALRAEVASLQEKLKKQIEDDMAILAKLRKENRELKKELRSLKLEIEAGKTIANQEVSKVVSQAQADATMKVQRPSAEEKEASRKQIEAASKTAEENKTRKESKDDSIWNHMFPF